MLKLSEFHVLAIVTSRGLLIMDDLCVYIDVWGDFYFIHYYFTFFLM